MFIGLIVGSFVWFLDVLICLMVSFVTLFLLLFVGVYLYGYFEDSMKRFEEWVHHVSERRLTVTGMVLLFLAVSILFRVVYLTWWKQYDNESMKFTVSILGSWLPFHLLHNYDVQVYPVTVYINKLYLIICLLLFVPIYGIAVSKFSKTSKTSTRIGFWIRNNRSKLSRGNKNPANEESTGTYHEYSEEEILNILYNSSILYNEKEIEVGILSSRVQRLQDNSAKLHGQIKKERDKNNELKLKMAEQEKQLQEQEKELASKRPLSRDFSGDDCMCVICMERTRQFNLKPCNHFCVCNICKPTLQNICPLCRKVVKRFERIYLE